MMAKTLWDDLKFHAGIAGDNFLEKSTIGKLLKGTYDSTHRLTHPTGDYNPNEVEDAFNVAGAAMVGGMPSVPKGGSPSTLGMAFRRPQDVVYTTDYKLKPSILKRVYDDNFDLYNLISRYHNKTWGTEADPVIQHIDKGFAVPNIPGLDSQNANDFVSIAKDMNPDDLADVVRIRSAKINQVGKAAKTDVGKYVELLRDGDELFRNTGISNNEHIGFSQGMPQKTKDYALNNDVHMFSAPSMIELASTQLPYKIEGNLNRMSLADMLMQASEKEAALERVPDDKLHEFDDGHYWTQLKTQAQRDAESDAMGNSIRLPMHDGKDLYSLRTKDGKSVLTASRKPGRSQFDEIKNNGNHVDVLRALMDGTNDYGYKPYAEALRGLLKTKDRWPFIYD